MNLCWYSQTSYFPSQQITGVLPDKLGHPQNPVQIYIRDGEVFGLVLELYYQEFNLAIIYAIEEKTAPRGYPSLLIPHLHPSLVGTAEIGHCHGVVVKPHTFDPDRMPPQFIT